ERTWIGAGRNVRREGEAEDSRIEVGLDRGFDRGLLGPREGDRDEHLLLEVHPLGEDSRQGSGGSAESEPRFSLRSSGHRLGRPGRGGLLANGHPGGGWGGRHTSRLPDDRTANLARVRAIRLRNDLCLAAETYRAH